MDEHESPVYFLCNHVGIAGKVGLAAKTLMEACMIRAKVRDWIKHHDLLPWGGNVLAACSGGADSLVLVDLLAEYHAEGIIRLFVAHFDHRLRGEASTRDAEFVRQFCLERNLPFFGGAADVREKMRLTGGSLEEVARYLRYDYLHSVLVQIGGGLIATGHHKDDQAETVLRMEHRPRQHQQLDARADDRACGLLEFRQDARGRRAPDHGPGFGNGLAVAIALGQL